MKKYITYMHSCLLRLFKASGHTNPYHGAMVAFLAIWALDTLYLIELFFFYNELPNPVSIIFAFLVAVFFYFYLQKKIIPSKKTEENSFNGSFIPVIFWIQLIFTIVAFGWFAYRYLTV